MHNTKWTVQEEEYMIHKLYTIWYTFLTMSKLIEFA